MSEPPTEVDAETPPLNPRDLAAQYGGRACARSRQLRREQFVAQFQDGDLPDSDQQVGD